MQAPRFINLPNNAVKRLKIHSLLPEMPTMPTMETYLSKVRELYPDKMLLEKLSRNDILTFLMISVIHATTEHQLAKFKSALHFIEIILSQKLNKNFRIESLAFEDEADLVIYFSDGIKAEAFQPDIISSREYCVTPDIFRQLHLVANAIIINLNNNQDPKSKHIFKHIKRIIFKKTLWDSHANIDYRINIEFSYCFIVGDDGKECFINEQCPFTHTFRNYSQTTRIHPTDFSFYNAFLSFEQSISIGDITRFELIMRFELNFLKNVIYLVNVGDSFHWKIENTLDYIMNAWINHLIFPGFDEGCVFEIANNPNHIQMNIHQYGKCVRTIYLKKMISSFTRWWFVLGLSFSDFFKVEMIDFNLFLNQDLLNFFYQRYHKKKPFCLLHPKQNPEHYYKNELFCSYQGVYFIRDWFRNCPDRPYPTFILKWAELENRFQNCHICVNHDFFQIIMGTTDLRFLKNLVLFSYFGVIPAPEKIASSSKDSRIVSSPSSSYIELDVYFTIFTDIPTRGGTISGAMIDFPQLNLSFEKFYKIRFNLNFIPPNNGNVRFSIWSVDIITQERDNILFEMNLDEIKIFRFVKTEQFQNKFFFYGESNNIWGPVKFNDSLKIFEDANFIPTCFEEYNLQRKIELQAKKNVNQFLFPAVTKSTSSGKDRQKISESDLLSNNNNMSFFFILQNNIDLPPETIEDQKKKNLLYVNSYLPGRKKNFLIKCRTLAEFQIVDLFTYDRLDYLISLDKITLPKTNRYFFNFFMHPDLRNLDLPPSVPQNIIMIKNINGRKEREYLGIKPHNASANSISSVSGTECNSITFFTLTEINTEKKFLKILFTED